MHDAPTTILSAFGTLPLASTVESDAQRALHQRQVPSISLMQRVLTGLRALTVRRCGQCGAEPVARPDLSTLTIDGRFCADCIEICLADTDPGHWCPIDELGL